MLQRLLIRNFILIDSLDIEWGSGMNIITGETGAGKSIVLGALGLLLGQRADSESVMDAGRKCIIEGVFHLPEDGHPVREYLRKNDLDESATVIIRREIQAEGKSRAFINDTPVNLQQLREVTSLLIDLHSQHENLLINSADFQLNVLDALAENKKHKLDYQSRFKAWQLLISQRDEWREKDNRSRAEQDFIRFQLTEWEEANLKEGEQEALEKEQALLTHTGEIIQRLTAASELLSGNETNILEQLRQLYAQVSGLTKYDTDLAQLAERLKSTWLELQDISEETENAYRRFQFDPERQVAVDERLDIIYRLQKKHRVNSMSELFALAEGWKRNLEDMDSFSDRLEALNQEIQKAEAGLIKASELLSARRKKIIPVLEKRLSESLKSVALPHATFRITMETTGSVESMGASGADRIRFLFSANPGFEPTDIGKAASGGEISRLMLCIKSAVAESMSLPTIIFDEIDTGISGETALRIGEMMHDMSRHHQMLVITHLPQIASRGNSHFMVKKSVSGKKTQTSVVALNADERIMEVARMLSGDKPTASALANAKDLLAW